jgi:hypothetical protein
MMSVFLICCSSPFILIAVESINPVKYIPRCSISALSSLLSLLLLLSVVVVVPS